jgi:hypothetical protein
VPELRNLIVLYFHVGLQKTGTTFLQQEVFPKWEGISYLKADLEVLLRLDEKRTYLVSCEGLSGQNWAHHDMREKSLKRLSEAFPGSRVLISFRKHSGYIVSSYRQYLQRGGALPFDEYFDLANDRGFMKRDDFQFRRKIDAIEEYFRRTPFVFLHEELRKDIEGLLADMECYIGGRAPAPASISMRQINAGVGYYPAKLLRWLNARTKSELNPDGQYDLNNLVLKRLKLTPRDVCRYWLAFLPSAPFLSESRVRAIDDFYEIDWAYVCSIASARRERAGCSLE